MDTNLHIVWIKFYYTFTAIVFVVVLRGKDNMKFVNIHSGTKGR